MVRLPLALWGLLLAVTYVYAAVASPTNVAGGGGLQLGRLAGLDRESRIALVAAASIGGVGGASIKKGASVGANTLFSKVDVKTGKRQLTYYGLMLAGAMARTVAATAVHPLNVCKTMLQTKGGVMPAFKWSVLSRGAGSQFIMSIPHGAINFAVTETTKTKLAALAANSTLLPKLLPKKLINPVLDFTSSAISTFICSAVSTPQMVLTDRIMAGVYPNFVQAVISIARAEGWRGFYLGWLPAILQKIPSYALTWMFFQQFKLAFLSFYGRVGTGLENTLIGSFAAAGACAVMIPVDTIKTRIVTQPNGRGVEPLYTGVIDCALKVRPSSAPFRSALPCSAVRCLCTRLTSLSLSLPSTPPSPRRCSTRRAWAPSTARCRRASRPWCP